MSGSQNSLYTPTLHWMTMALNKPAKTLWESPKIFKTCQYTFQFIVWKTGNIFPIYFYYFFVTLCACVCVWNQWKINGVTTSLYSDVGTETVLPEMRGGWLCTYLISFVSKYITAVSTISIMTLDGNRCNQHRHIVKNRVFSNQENSYS